MNIESFEVFRDEIKRYIKEGYIDSKNTNGSLMEIEDILRKIRGLSLDELVELFNKEYLTLEIGSFDDNGERKRGYRITYGERPSKGRYPQIMVYRTENSDVRLKINLYRFFDCDVWGHDCFDYKTNLNCNSNGIGIHSRIVTFARGFAGAGGLGVEYSLDAPLETWKRNLKSMLDILRYLQNGSMRKECVEGFLEGMGLEC